MFHLKPLSYDQHNDSLAHGTVGRTTVRPDQMHPLRSGIIHKLKGWPCTQCVNELLVERHSRCTVMYHLHKKAHFPHSLAHAVFEYVQWYDTKLEFKRQYLVEIILAGGSCFRPLYNFHNDCCTIHCGKTNRFKDPIEHIVEFVVGECQTDRHNACVINW